jgi:hypothetical protein
LYINKNAIIIGDLPRRYRALFDGLDGTATDKSFNTWRTYQMSDHLIMWSEFSVDRTEAYLNALHAGEP